MKKVLFLLFFLLFFLSFKPLTSIFAHEEGTPAFFTVNGIVTSPSPFEVGGVSPNAFSAPQDIAPQNYLVNQPIEFEIDIKQLETVYPKEILDKTIFSWDFGDNQSAEGLENTHSYSKIGSYTLSVTANYNRPDIPIQLIESIQLDIIPSIDYQLPQPIIKINNIEVKEPLKGALSIDLNRKLTFDAKDSKSPSSKIVEYTWDFDDGNTSDKPITTHRYKLPQFYVSPSLRIKDENGFVAYTFVDITNSGKNEPNNPTFEDLKDSLSPIIGGVLGVALLVGGFIFFKKKL